MDSGPKLNSVGLFFDDENRVNLLDPESRESSKKLLNDCNLFLNSSMAFMSLLNEFRSLANSVAQRVEEAKVRAIGSRNSLQAMDKERVARRQQLQAMIEQKEAELNRLSVFYDSLQRKQQEEDDLMNRMSNSRTWDVWWAMMSVYSESSEKVLNTVFALWMERLKEMRWGRVKKRGS